jgi:hypothetical protein
VFNALATLDLSSAIASAGSTVGADFQSGLEAIIAIVLPVIFAIFVWRKVRGQAH